MSYGKKIAGALLFLGLLAVSPRAGFAADAGAEDDYDGLIRTGSAAEIRKAMKKRHGMAESLIGDDKDTPLMLAVKYGRGEEIVSLMLRSGADLSAQNANGQDALQYACRYSEDEAVIRLLLKKSGSKKDTGRKLLRKDSGGLCALDYAKSNPSPAALSLIRPYVEKADKNAAAEYEQTAAPAAAAPESAAAAVPESAAAAGEKADSGSQTAGADDSAGKGAAEDGAPPGRESPDGRPAVSKYRKIYLYDYAPKEQPDVPQETETRDTPLARIENPDETDADGRTALMKAAKAGNGWEVRSLISSGADVNLKDRDGWTALMYAVRYQNSLGLVGALLDAGADIQAASVYGVTTLQLAACYSSDPEILNTILGAYSPGEDELFRAFVLAITAAGASAPAQTARLRLFLDRGLPLNRFYEGRTPLMYAAQYSSSTEILRLFLENGADPSVRTADGKTAFDFARANGRLARDETYWLLNAGR